MSKHEGSKIVGTSTRLDNLRLLGGRLCLDFTNTVDPRIGEGSYDFLFNYLELVKWCRRIGLLTEDEAKNLLGTAKDHPVEAAKAFVVAINLREAMYRVFSAIAREERPQTVDLDALRSAFAEALTHAHIMPVDHGFQWIWNKSEDELHSMVWPIVRSAVELLTSEDVKRVKECPGVGDCGWLFLDTSKNGSRQWCSMEGCGSRAKMRRQYSRKRVSKMTALPYSSARP